MGHGKSLGSFDGPPIFLYVHGWATKQKSMSTSKNKDINNKSKLSKLSNANNAIEASTYYYYYLHIYPGYHITEVFFSGVLQL
jgi:hypothetical protein